MCELPIKSMTEELVWLRVLKRVLDLNSAQHKLRRSSLQMYCHPVLHMIITKMVHKLLSGKHLIKFWRNLWPCSQILMSILR